MKVKLLDNSNYPFAKPFIGAVLEAEDATNHSGFIVTFPKSILNSYVTKRKWYVLKSSVEVIEG